ncbi:MAG: hypothetical protein GX986_01700 [Firmicutes bacterium]|nr:hypothetical protein [Bacillota bacterium]
MDGLVEAPVATSGNRLEERTVILLGKQVKQRECIVCKCSREAGISVLGWHVCSECEDALVKSKVHSPGYDMYVESLKTIWRGISLNWHDGLGVGTVEPIPVSHTWEASICTKPNTN